MIPEVILAPSGLTALRVLKDSIARDPDAHVLGTLVWQWGLLVDQAIKAYDPVQVIAEKGLTWTADVSS